ncbi:MAG: nucleotide sugar dehydrogenase [Flavobacteriales bacterium]|jgi:UDP-N-acetyl-D-galactosamine dehydrogenase|uniref:nucleotide sugar dehydrogenase n=1 Tax=Candidatus Ulvibacter alkanivorans TaxID=2267620 RepID=UPI000DF3DBF3|nr:nucleotide sugar dehydrogenase [Candidatus Ulvibacter alkanivorans]MCH2489672.1 nucleotide sugar dehydrogenase [Flavobacteriales bacterium]
MKEKPTIAIIGLGYVGLPLAVAFAEQYKVIGFDINTQRVAELQNGEDHTLEVSKENLQQVLTTSEANGLQLTSVAEEMALANVFIVTVPTPTNKYNQPVLTPLQKASETIGAILKKDDIVVYESTVYPGVTEDICVPILEEVSGLTFNSDFFAGYSPERINPGDKKHTVTKILKVTSGSTPEAAQYIDKLYASVITAGTHLAPSIKVAEAAKVIENSQRDINIAFVNELSKIFRLLDIDTQDVLEAAATKWNFLKFTPGLVGGHCIGVDPYYLAQKAQEEGYNPEIILAGRRMNDGMGNYVAHEVVKLMIRKDCKVKNGNVLVLGITFKENCPDIRNSKVIDVITELEKYNLNIDVYDPWADPEQVKREFDLSLLSEKEQLRTAYDAVVLTVAHTAFTDFPIENHTADKAVVFDVKAFLNKDKIDGRL